MKRRRQDEKARSKRGKGWNNQRVSKPVVQNMKEH